MATQELYGLGFSPLSITNRSRGFAEELMVQKRTGQMSMLDASLNTLSYDSLFRSGLQLQSMYQSMIDDNSLGKIYRVRLDDDLSRIVAANGNVITSAVAIPTSSTAINKVKFNVDCDVFTRSGCTPIDASAITVTIAFKIVAGSNTLTLSTSNKLSLLNNETYNVSYSGYTIASGATYTLTITGVTFTAASSFSYTSNTLSLYDILVGII